MHSTLKVVGILSVWYHQDSFCYCSFHLIDKETAVVELFAQGTIASKWHSRDIN